MYCPRCASEKTRVYGTRKGLSNIRFRECISCKYKFMSKEILMEDLLSLEYNDYLQDIGEITPGERDRVKSDK